MIAQKILYSANYLKTSKIAFRHLKIFLLLGSSIQMQACFLFFLFRGHHLAGLQRFLLATGIIWKSFSTWIIDRFFISERKVLGAGWMVFLNPCGLSDQLVVYLNIAKSGWADLKARSTASRQNKNFIYFDSKLRFALLALLRLAIFRKI